MVVAAADTAEAVDNLFESVELVHHTMAVEVESRRLLLVAAAACMAEQEAVAYAAAVVEVAESLQLVENTQRLDNWLAEEPVDLDNVAAAAAAGVVVANIRKAVERPAEQKH